MLNASWNSWPTGPGTGFLTTSGLATPLLGIEEESCAAAATCHSNP